MNHQNNQYGNKQNLHRDFNQNTHQQYNRANQYGQGNQYRQNITPDDQYDQQQTENNNQYFNQPTSQQYNQYRTNQQIPAQQAKMIKNPEKGIVHSPEMNDRDYLNDILATEKYLTDGFNTFVREASHTDLHNDVKTILNETHDCTRNLFDLMFKDGFYSFQGASGQEIQQAQQKFSKYLAQQDPYGTNNI